MQHTLVAVFDNRTDAQNAMNELLSSGFSRTDVRLSNADPTGQTDSTTGRSDLDTERSLDGDTGITASIKNFFSDLFGSDNAEHVSRYEGAVSRGHHVLTLVADSLPEVERGADIVERYGPTDIDENATGTPDLGAAGMAGGMSAGAMGMGSSAGLQQSSSFSSQSAQSGASLSGMSAPGSASSMSSSTPGSSQLDNPGDRPLFQQQSMNQTEPTGGTYQETMGKSGLTATGGTSLQSSTLRETPLADTSTSGGLSAGNVQRDDNALANTPPAVSPLAGSSLGQAAGTSTQPASTQGTSLQGSSLDGSARQGSTIDDRNDSLSGGMRSDSLQRDTAIGDSLSGSANLDKQRSGVRIFSRSQSDAALGTATGLGASGMESGMASGTSSTRSLDPRDDLDGSYRSHFDTTYGATGASYDEYQPAYSYGSEAARSDRYSNRAWDDIETDLRSGWDSRIDGTRDFSTTGSDSSEPSAWERVKNAVRHGWDRMTDDHGADDTYYRDHWNTTYGVAGSGSYDEYRPAYTYGSDMARDERYRGRQWDAVETDLRSDWDSRYGSDGDPSTWDKMKAAVRRGWDRMTDDDDDVYYRNHWNSVYGATGEAAYDEYRPAYSYGSEMALNEKYRGRQWNDVETDLRSDWDTRYPGEQSTWDKMKSAVRHGWDRMMS